MNLRRNMVRRLLGALVSLMLVSCSDEHARVNLAPAERLQWWQDLKFGVMVVWGPWSLSGHGLIWQIVDPQTTPAQRTEYFDLYRRFDPTRFDADRWARLVRRAGARYVVLTTKHHDGFSNWDTATTDFRISAPESGFRRHSQADLTRRLIEAFRRQDVAIGLYYSHFDWHHPDGLWQKHHWNRIEKLAKRFPDRWRRFVRFERRQLQELLSDYGQIDILWFDGKWKKAGAPDDVKPLLEMARRLQPGIVMNDRGTTSMFADFSTWEQKIPNASPAGPWETSMTISQGRGYWYKGESAQYKTTTALLRALVEVVSKGGNFLLSVGPRPDGTLPPPETQRLQEIGAWLDANGEAIYGTTPHPGSVKYPWGYITRNDQRVYVIVFDWPTAGSLVVRNEARQVQDVSLLVGNTPLPYVIEGQSDLRLFPPKKQPEAYPWVVRIEHSPAPNAAE